MERKYRLTAAVALMVTAFGWALAPIFIRYMSVAYDAHTQNLLRYGSAAAPLLVISLLAFRDGLRVAFRNVRGLLGISALNIVQQHVWTLGCAGSTATTAQLISKISIVFVIVFSFFLFREERAVIRSPIYLIGTLLSFIGVGAVISRDPASVVPVFDVPTLLLLLTAVLWAVYTVWGRHLVMNLHPIPMFTVISVYTTLGFAALAFLTGRPAALIDAGPRLALLGVVSGIIPIAIAHPAFHYAQKHLGSALCTSLVLFNPLITNLIALFVWRDERLVATQWFGAIGLLLGTFLVTYAGHRHHARQ